VVGFIFYVRDSPPGHPVALTGRMKNHMLVLARLYFLKREALALRLVAGATLAKGLGAKEIVELMLME
jgi:hypothetical protein